MANKFDDLAKEIVKGVGGADNVNVVYHCITRLRFELKDSGKADRDTIRATPGVLGLVEGNGQFQVVIGNDVPNVFEAVTRLYPVKTRSMDGDGEDEVTEKPQGTLLLRAMNTMSTIFTPIVPALAGAGMLKAVLVLLSRTFGVLDPAGSTYLILNAAGNSVFFFLPILLAFSSARAFKCNQFIAAAIVAALLEPSFTGLGGVGTTVAFMNIPVVMMGYTGTVIPAIMSIYVYSKFEIIIKKIIPQNIHIFALALVALFIMVPLTVMVIGPIGVAVGNGLAAMVNFLSTKSGLLTGAVLGGGWSLLVMFGVHWGIVPLMINNLSLNGYDTIRPMMSAATFASAGVAIGVYFRSRNKATKALALSAMAPALLGGITEPVIYGLSLRFKRPFIAQIIGGAIGGGFMGMMQTKATVYVFPALTTLPAFFGDTFKYFIIGMLIAITVTAVLTYILGFDEDAKEITKKQEV
ncbi:MAG: PTS transporter subunit EIIC [Deferribacteraceae bacterium]|jgi:PTS system beta-glucosides-specific IIC component|nr:PTS transporter subunit EIIC [Deferribacteraceae bacterium]